MADIASPTTAFVRDCLRVDTADWVPTNLVHAAWKSWCMGRGKEDHTDEKTLGRNLRAVIPSLSKKRIRISGSRTYVYQGIRLVAPDELGGDEDEVQGGSERQRTFL